MLGPEAEATRGDSDSAGTDSRAARGMHAGNAITGGRSTARTRDAGTGNRRSAAGRCEAPLEDFGGNQPAVGNGSEAVRDGSAARDAARSVSIFDSANGWALSASVDAAGSWRAV